MKKIDSQIEKVYELLEQGTYTTEVFLARNTKLLNNKEDLLKAISDLSQEISSTDSMPKLDIKTVEKLLDTYTKLNSAEGKNKILKALLNKIEYEKDTQNRKGQRNNENFVLTLYPKLPQK